MGNGIWFQWDWESQTKQRGWGWDLVKIKVDLKMGFGQNIGLEMGIIPPFPLTFPFHDPRHILFLLTVLKFWDLPDSFP